MEARRKFCGYKENVMLEVQYGDVDDLRGLKFDQVDTENSIVFEFEGTDELSLRPPDGKVLLRLQAIIEPRHWKVHDNFYNRSELEGALKTNMKRWILDNAPTTDIQRQALLRA
ncbi:hypothetical protein F4782DRAFT_534535 [Xylaria castorea]|nr:hypothetical protein F4782DRAFT_534535 [Xylaria castorea]